MRLDFSDGFDLQRFVASQGEEAIMPGMQFEQVSANVHRMTLSQEGVNMVWEFHLVDETTMEALYTFDMSLPGVGDCSMSMDFDIEYQGE